MKKLLILIFLPLYLFSQNYNATILEDANIREETSLDSHIVTIKLQGEKVFVLKKLYTHNWVWYKTKRGYISGDLLDIFGKYPKKEKISSNHFGKKILEEVAIYKTPSLKGKIIANYKPSDNIKLYGLYKNGECGTWYKTQKGYIQKQYVIPKEFLLPVKYDTLVCENKVETLVVKKENKLKATKTIEEIVEANFINEEESEQTDINELNKLKFKKQALKKNKKEIKNNFFIGASFAYSLINANKDDKNGSIVLSDKLDKDTFSYNLEIGYYLNKKSFLITSLSYIPYEYVSFINYMISYNYIFDLKYNPYLGITLGISEMELTKARINGSLVDKKDRIYAYGIQLGTNTKLTTSWDFYIQYQYLINKHKTKLESGTARSEIIRDHHQSLGLGLRYNF